ncbi:Toll/interleukin-1 receptor homology (TIR) domain superfamily [Arabidopsis thaliana x Arabidopsis arenosa]|uniref:ADP-ribosyl cyclase/cyclic ADP-ribose hydrolase n=1 Tax=Arabidopsis thaliana x Arabidopsis arenosa TaxID=1240361 RepID=A0A8T1YYF3_9BRAS|nr:Toll/interleukin-1 receptor homology (TIR) domain superfamily [Arabidopsis thaliana x Arabidopsis arenosa]
MAISSSLSLQSCHWRHHVFPSFSGKDVRRTFLSHLLKEFRRKGIRTFIDNDIKRSQMISSELVQAIRESRIAVVVLSRTYASSSWCLNELVEIKKVCQKIMPVFYEVDPSDVRKLMGEFGKAFEEACERQPDEEVKQKWREALADLIDKIAMSISYELNSTPSRDSDNLVGINAHMREIDSLLCLESTEVKMVGIWGPAGIGKTTIARALFNRLSENFQHTIFMENVKGSSRTSELDAYGFKLHLQEQFLSEVIDHKHMKIHDLGLVKERLQDLKVLVVLDDVDKLEQLDALVKQSQWFGSGSRIIVTTENKQLLRAHGIKLIYELGFPSRSESLQIFCQYAFGESSAPDGCIELATEITKLAGYLPLALKVLGSSLRGMSKYEQKSALPRLRTSLNEDIRNVLRVSYDGLHEKDKALFLHIACLFNGENVDYVKQILASSGLDVNFGLQVLTNRSLIHISRTITMHNLLEQLGWEVICEQSINEPGKRQFLTDASEIYDVLADNTGTGAVLGISLDISKINEWFLNERAFGGMHNLLFLKFYKSSLIKDQTEMHLPRGLDYLPRKLRLLHWDAFPMTSLPMSFRPEFLVVINIRESQLEKLWEGTQPLRSLKQMDLSKSENLKEIPDLSKAVNIEELCLSYCGSLVMLPSSIKNLNKLVVLDMKYCSKLEIIPCNMDLESLSILNLDRCSRLQSFPEISSKIGFLSLSGTAIEEVPKTVASWPCLAALDMSGCKNLKTFPCLPKTIEWLDLSRTGIEEVPLRIDKLSKLNKLLMNSCMKLRSISSGISTLEHIETLDFLGCKNVVRFPVEIFESSRFCHNLVMEMRNIQNPDLPRPFYFKNNYIDTIPDCITRHCKLPFLNSSRSISSKIENDFIWFDK